MDATARPAGQPAPRLEKRSGDDRAYTVDCSALLRQHELMVCVLSISAAGGMNLTARTRQGRRLELQASGGEVPTGQPHKDHDIAAHIKTTQGTLVVAVEMRVHP